MPISGFGSAPTVALLPIESADPTSTVFADALTVQVIAALATALPMPVTSYLVSVIAESEILCVIWRRSIGRADKEATDPRSGAATGRKHRDG